MDIQAIIFFLQRRAPFQMDYPKATAKSHTLVTSWLTAAFRTGMHRLFWQKSSPRLLSAGVWAKMKMGAWSLIVSLQKTLQLNPRDIDYVYNCLQFIELLWCQMISCRIEQVFISELAYAADYVISRKGNIESPAFVSYSLFPQNYNDFHYEEYYEKYDALWNSWYLEFLLCIDNIRYDNRYIEIE